MKKDITVSEFAELIVSVIQKLREQEKLKESETSNKQEFSNKEKFLSSQEFKCLNSDYLFAYNPDFREVLLITEKGEAIPFGCNVIMDLGSFRMKFSIFNTENVLVTDFDDLIFQS